MYKIQNVVLPSTWWYGTGINYINTGKGERRKKRHYYFGYNYFLFIYILHFIVFMRRKGRSYVILILNHMGDI